MQSRSVKLRVGILITIALVTLIGFVITLGNISLRSGYTIYVDFDYIGNLKLGAPVRVSGIKVGKIADVEFMGGRMDEKQGRRVQVRLEVWLENRVRETLRSDAEFFINTAGVLGEQYLEVVPGDNYEQPPIAPESYHVGHNPPRTDLLLARFYEVLDSVSDLLRDDRELIRNLLKDSAGAVSQVNTLLAENREPLGTLIRESGRLAGEASTTLATVNRDINPQLIAKTVRDADALLLQADRSLTELTPPVKTLVTDATRVTGLVTEARVERALGAVDKASGAVDKASSLVGNADALLTEIRQGKGTVGALLVREEIYADLREMIRDLKRNPWKFFWKE